MSPVNTSLGALSFAGLAQPDVVYKCTIGTTSVNNVDTGVFRQQHGMGLGENLRMYWAKSINMVNMKPTQKYFYPSSYL